MLNGSMILRALAVAASLLISACTTLPGGGPAVLDVEQSSQESGKVPDGYVMVPLSADALSTINAFAPLAFPKEFSGNLGGTRALTVGVGDRLIVNIWEPSQDGVFATAENRQATLQVVVEEDGGIHIPYAGRIKAAGRSVESVRKAIENGLQGKAVEPQVQVVLEQNNANAVVVVGDVNKPGQLPVPVRGLRLMTAIAEAGGTREATYETIATVTRGKRVATIRLDEIVNVPQNNIWLATGDNVLVVHQPRTYSAFGAVSSSGLMPFKTETLTMAEALAQVGGLNDQRADSGGVFVFRYENRELADWLVNAGQGRGRPKPQGKAHDLVPLIYRLDFKDPQSFFVAQGFRMRDKDMLYVANHPTAEFGKFLSMVVAPILGTAQTVRVISE